MPCCAGLTVDCCNVYSKLTDPCYQKLCRIKRRQIYGECCGVESCCHPPCPRPPPPGQMCCEPPCPCCPPTKRPRCPTEFPKPCCPPRCSLPCFPPPNPCCPCRPMIVRPVKKCCPSPCKMSQNNKCPCPIPCCNPYPPCCVVVQPCQPKCPPSPCCPPPPACQPACPQPDPRCCPKPLVVSFSCPTSVTPMKRPEPGCGGRNRLCCRPRWDESPPKKCQSCWSIDFPCLPPVSQRYCNWISSVSPVVDSNLFASRLSSRADNCGCQIVGVEPPPQGCCC